MTVTRTVGALAALIVCGWFALGIVQSRDVDRASAIVAAPGRVGAAAAVHATSLLKTAGVLNPDAEIDLLRAQLAVRRGELIQARAILMGVVRREPMNVNAWAALARASAGDPSAFRVAVVHVRELAPVVPAN